MPSSPAPRALPFRTRLTATLRRWFDTAHVARDDVAGEGIDWLRALPFLGMHLACLAVFAVGVSPVALATALAEHPIAGEGRAIDPSQFRLPMYVTALASKLTGRSSLAAAREGSGNVAPANTASPKQRRVNTTPAANSTSG